MAIALACLALWWPRKPGPARGAAHAEGEESGRMPWILALVCAATAAFAAVYLTLRMLQPPNW